MGASADKMMGCSHSVPELQSMWPRVIALDIAEQAKYADALCIDEAEKADFCREQLSYIDKTFPLSPPTNTTGVGNLAHMTLHAHADYREEFRCVHAAYIAMLRRSYRL